MGIDMIDIEKDESLGRTPFLSMRMRMVLLGGPFFLLLVFLIWASLPRAQLAVSNLLITESARLSLGWIRPWIGLIMGALLALAAYVLLRVFRSNDLPKRLRSLYAAVWSIYVLVVGTGLRRGWPPYEFLPPLVVICGVGLVLVQVPLARRYGARLSLKTRDRWILVAVFLSTLALFSVVFPFLYVLSPRLETEDLASLRSIDLVERVEGSLPYMCAQLWWGPAPLISLHVRWRHPSLTITAIDIRYIDPFKEWGYTFGLPSRWRPQSRHPTKRLVLRRLHGEIYPEENPPRPVSLNPLLARMDNMGYVAIVDQVAREYENQGYDSDLLTEGALALRSWEDGHSINLEYYRQLDPTEEGSIEVALAASFSPDLQIEYIHIEPYQATVTIKDTE